jgi:hypothetical protein
MTRKLSKEQKNVLQKQQNSKATEFDSFKPTSVSVMSIFFAECTEQQKALLDPESRAEFVRELMREPIKVTDLKYLKEGKDRINKYDKNTEKFQNAALKADTAFSESEAIVFELEKEAAIALIEGIHELINDPSFKKAILDISGTPEGRILAKQMLLKIGRLIIASHERLNSDAHSDQDARKLARLFNKIRNSEQK